MNNDPGMWIPWGGDWFPGFLQSSPIWPHALGFISGFPGGYLPLLWTLHHWWGEVSEFHLWSASGLFVKHNCLPGSEPCLDSEKVQFILLLCSFWITLDGVSWRSVDSGSHCPKDEKNPRVGFMEKKICECAGGCGDLEEMEAAFGSWSSSLEFSVNHCWIHSPSIIFDLVCMLTGLYWVASSRIPTLTNWVKGVVSGWENQGREETPDYRKDKDGFKTTQSTGSCISDSAGGSFLVWSPRVISSEILWRNSLALLHSGTQSWPFSCGQWVRVICDCGISHGGQIF